MKHRMLVILLLSAGAAVAQTDALVAKGQYLARAGDCISCHTKAQGGAPFAGGLAMKTGFGTIVSTNITPDLEQGIGRYTEQEFGRALRQGRARDEHYLYPAMPYANFSKLSDADVAALYAYFMKGVAPAKQANPATDLTWPFSLRSLMALWNKLYLPDQPYATDGSKGAPWNRGAYLVQGLGHCSACHTPRNLAGAEKADTDQGGRAYLAGGVIDGWYAQPLRDTWLPGLSSWSAFDIVQYLQTGRNSHTAAFGPMAQVVGNSTQYLELADLQSIAIYLKSVGASEAQPPQAPASSSTAADLRAGNVQQRGALVYLNNCSACHRSDGQGAARTFPRLAGNSVVAAADPTSLIRLVLQGSDMPRTVQAPSTLGMPGYGWRLNDQNLADVLTFIRASWGNRSAPLDASDVAKVRRDLAQVPKPAGM